MKIAVNIKQIGSRKEAVKKEVYELPGVPSDVEELIRQFVTICVERFNQSIHDEGRPSTNADFESLSMQGNILRYLSSEEIADRSSQGKISLPENYTTKKQNLNQAVDNALQSYQDGIFRIFINDVPLRDIKDPITLNENDTLTFIRLTMLAGRMW